MPRYSNRVFRKRVPWQKTKNTHSLILLENRSLEPSRCEAGPSRPNQENASETPSHKTSTGVECSSYRKLSGVEQKYDKFCTGSESNEVIDISILSDILQQNVCCKECGKLGISLKTKRHIGLAAELELSCAYCTFSVKFFNSSTVNSPQEDTRLYSVNIRLVYGLRTIGKGRAAGAMLCGVMNLPTPPSKFDHYNYILGSAVEDVALECMKEAVEEAVEENGNSRDLTVALDGSWHKRGHTSLNGVVTATSVDTGKVIDVAVMSKHCRCPGRLKNQHDDKCIANYSGSSGGMEVAGVKTIFQRSLQWYNARYIKYLGDGDSKAFKEVLELKPYGENIQITKLECVGHVQKRMGSRLRRLKTSMKGKKLCDGKTLDGRNRLTDPVIDYIQRCYGLAIRQNTHNAEAMRRAVWALFLHVASTNDKPQHSLCPVGTDSWCKYNRGKETNEEYNHHHSLPTAIIETIKPIFRDLADLNLLKKCLHGRTQNPNECVNRVIWDRLPKTVFVGINTLHLGVFDAVASFNQGNITKCKVLEKLGLCVGSRTVKAMHSIDMERLRSSENAVKSIINCPRSRRGTKRRLVDEIEENEDNPSYGPGMH